MSRFIEFAGVFLNTSSVDYFCIRKFSTIWDVAAYRNEELISSECYPPDCDEAQKRYDEIKFILKGCV